MNIRLAFLSTLLSLLSPSRAFVPSRPFRSRVSIVATKSEAAPSPSPSALREERELLEVILRDKVTKKVPGEAAALRAKLADLDYAIALNSREATAKAIQRVSEREATGITGPSFAPVIPSAP